jgi:hypothetical protein
VGALATLTAMISVPPSPSLVLSGYAFANTSDRPVRFLNLATPAGFEGYMRELGEAFRDGGPPTSEAIGRIAARYDSRPA